MTNKEDYTESEEKFKKYYAVKMWDDNNVYVRIFHDNSDESKKQLESAHKNKMVEKISGVFWADCRANAERIAEEEFGIAEEIE